MCTATWLRSETGFSLCFNRDEMKTRQQALPPEIESIDTVNVIMPVDPEGKGSWIAVNEYGLAICLLNNYGAKINVEQRQWLSRGQIIRKLSSATCIQEVDKRIEAMNLFNVKGFQVLALCSRFNEPLISSWVWDGLELLHVRDGQQIFSSSSFNTQPVVSNRQQFFEQYIAEHEVTIENLRQFHKTENTEDSRYGVCMVRSEAETVSYTEIHVKPNSVSMCYVPGRPSQTQIEPIQKDLKRVVA